METQNQLISEQINFSSKSEKVLKPFFEKGLSYKLLSRVDFIKSVDDCLGKPGHANDCDAFYLHKLNTIVLDKESSRGNNFFIPTFFHEFIHMIRFQEPEILAVKPMSFMPEALYNIYDKKFKGLDIVSGIEEMKLILFQWREEVVCELLSHFMSINFEGISKNDLITVKPTFIYLISGGFNEDDLLKFKDSIHKECLKTIDIINRLSNSNLDNENFSEYFEKEYILSVTQVKAINKRINATPTVRTYNAFKKRVFF